MNTIHLKIQINILRSTQQAEEETEMGTSSKQKE